MAFGPDGAPAVVWVRPRRGGRRKRTVLGDIADGSKAVPDEALISVDLGSMSAEGDGARRR